MAKTAAQGFDNTATDSPISETTAFKLSDLRIQKFEFQDFIMRLPIGVFVHGQRLQHLEFHPYTTEHDLMLTRKSNEDINVTLSRFLPTIIKSIGGYPLEDIARELSAPVTKVIERMYLADALTVVLNIRHTTVGDNVAITDKCGRCNTKVEDNDENGYHDMGQVDIRTIVNLQDTPLIEVELERGFSMFDHTARRIHMQPFKLFQMPKLKGVSEKKIALHMMYQMICGMPDIPEYDGITSNLFDDNTYRSFGTNLADRDRLTGAAETLINLGPRMLIDLTCDACGHEWRSLLPWQMLDSFLSQSAATTARRLLE